MDTTPILHEYNLRSTPSRKEILSLFAQHDFALSNAFIEDKLKNKYDRVTIYRTLKTFLERGLIHKVLDDSSLPKYALCKAGCSSHHHDHQHVHFKCRSCGLTTCLDDIKIPQIHLPSGFFLEESNLLLEGICKDCPSV